MIPSNTVSHPFPLLSLPKNVLNPILKSMELHIIISFSLLSKKLTCTIKPFEPMPIDVYVQQSMKFCVDNRIGLCEIKQRVDQLLAKVNELCGVSIVNYLAQAMRLLRQTSIRMLSFQNDLDEDFLEYVFSLIPTCENITIYSDVSNTAQRRILAKYGSTTKHLSFYSIPPAGLKEKIVTQNLDFLSVHEGRMNLDQLLMANCSSLGAVNLDLKTLNKFFKLWIQNKTSPRLEYMLTETLKFLDLKVVLAGIQYTEVSWDTVRTFKHSKKAIESDDWLVMTDTVEVCGGYDFRRRDGTCATISNRVGWRLEFFVWAHN